jgi:hypothetical protein
MPWITLTAEKIEGRFTEREKTALTTAAKSEAQTSEFFIAEAIRMITNSVRSSVAACEKNMLGPDGTIPDELESAALALIRGHLYTRLPGMKALFDDLRQAELKSAERRLERTADCKVAIVPPVAPSAHQAGGPAVQLINSRPQKFSPSQTAGL